MKIEMFTSLSRNKASFFRFPRIAFTRQSKIETVYKVYLAALATFESFNVSTIKSIPPFFLNNFLFLLHSLQRFEIIEKQSSFISIGLSAGFSFSCYNKSIKLSNIPFKKKLNF